MKLKLLLNHLHNKRVLQGVQCVATVAVTSAILAGAQDASNAHKQQNMAMAHAAACELTNDLETNLDEKTTEYQESITDKKRAYALQATYEDAEAQCDPYMNENELDTLVHVETVYSNLNIRQEPNSTSEIIGTLSDNQVVAFLDDVEDSLYLKVAVGDKIGYVHSKFISDEDLTEVGYAAPVEQPVVAVASTKSQKKKSTKNKKSTSSTITDSNIAVAATTAVADTNVLSEVSAPAEEIPDTEEFYDHDEDVGYVLGSEDADVEATEVSEETVQLAQETPAEETTETVEVAVNTYNGPKLNSRKGTVQGPSGKETYYNLNMKRVVKNLKNMGIEGEYWVREDGAKMYGDKILVAANLSVHPRGSTVETSLGSGVVADTGTFAASNPNQIDIATNW